MIYAWFVSNNRVTAEVNSISAKSNAAYLEIDNQSSLETAGTSTTVTLNSNPTALYPATPKLDTFTTGASPSNLKWNTAYAALSTSADAQKDDDGNAIYYELNDTTGYLISTDVYLTTSQGTFNSLAVESFSATANDTGATIVNAVGALITSESNEWVLFEYNTGSTKWEITKSSNANKLLCADTGDVIKDKVTDIDGYKVTITLYYDGDYETVKTSEFDALKSAKTSLAFTAVPVQQGVNGTYTQGTGA